MNGVRLRRGSSADVDAMHALDLVCFAPVFQFSWSTMRESVEEPGAIVVVAEACDLEGQNELAGFIIAHLSNLRGVERAYVVTLDVRPRLQRQGVAASLLAEVERQARAAGACSVDLHVFAGNQPAIRFYERTGFLRMGLHPNLYGLGLDAWSYRKRLGPE